MKEGKPTYTYNWLALQRANVATPSAARTREAYDSCTNSFPMKPNRGQGRQVGRSS